MSKKYKNSRIPREPQVKEAPRQLPKEVRQELTKQPKRRFGSRRVWLTVAIVAAVLIIGGGAGLFVTSRNRQPIPAGISKQLSFSPFVLAKSRAGGATAGSYKYDKSQGVFSFVLMLPNKHAFTVSEQASPQNFSEIPGLYTKLLDGLNQFDTVSTFNGTLTLTRPGGNAEAGVLNDKGVLMFIRTTAKQVGKDEWKQVTEMMDIDKLNN